MAPAERGRPSAAVLSSRLEAAGWAHVLRAAGRTVVFTNGCFDVLHPGHAHLLEKAAALGDACLVGINSDASVRRLKGPGRPLMTLNDRARLLLAVRWVDRVVPFEEDTPLELIRAVRPHVLVKGGDYAPGEVVGGGDVAGWGARVEIIPFLEGFSTTRFLERLRDGFAKES